MIYEKPINCTCFGYIGDVHLTAGYSIDNEIHILRIIHKHKLVNYTKKKIDAFGSLINTNDFCS